MRGDDLQVFMIVVLFAYSADSTWREGVGVSFTYRLKKTKETRPTLNYIRACYDMWMWLTGRPFEMSGSEGKRILFSPSETGDLGQL
jgi:hypothetical protein